MYTGPMQKATIVYFLLSFSISLSFAQTASKPKLYGVQVSGRKIVIHGGNLSKVEVWAVPSGTGITPDMSVVVGTATRNKAGPKQVWLLSLEPCPLDAKAISATEVFVKAYDSHGRVVATKSLPYQGATEVYNGLCGNPK